MEEGEEGKGGRVEEGKGEIEGGGDAKGMENRGTVDAKGMEKGGGG